jgi:predicted 3-demethylubiquinone-9 3-methyltransferase (glyoxalase superfamily)
MREIVPCLWFDNQAEDAVALYVDVFQDARIDSVSRYSEAGPGQPGSVMTAVFEIKGQKFLALNGGPVFTFTPAISFQVMCETQSEVDDYWERLSANGGQTGQCGWLTDRFGVSWQIVPTALASLLSSPDAEKSRRATEAMLQMTKLDIAALQAAYDGD